MVAPPFPCLRLSEHLSITQAAKADLTGLAAGLGVFSMRTNDRRARFGSLFTTALALVAIAGLMAGCGVGGGKNTHVDRPVVRSFSPFLSPLDLNSLLQNPTFTNGALTVSTDPAYPGKVVIFFQEDTEIDPASVFLGGSSALGVDPSSLQFTQEIPGTGNVLVPVHVTVEADRIILQPQGPTYATGTGPGAITNLPDGQYTVGVFDNVRNTEGKGLVQGPVFHTFTVGTADTITPRVLTTSPVNGAKDVGAGAPAQTGPPGFEDTVASVTTNIFGPTTPDVIVRFTEGVKSSSITANNISVINAGPGGGLIPPAAGFPKLKSLEDLATLPSNGHEAIWRADTTANPGFPFGAQIQVSVEGALAADGTTVNPAPITDLADNQMENTFQFQFQTVAPPDLPQNPFPEYAIWWSASDRIGALDPVNQQGLADNFLGTQTFPLGVPANVIPDFTDTIATEQNIPNFDPFEIVIDTRTNFGTCHTWVYVQSFESGQVAIVNSRTSVPVALINSPSPGGIACQTATTGPNVLLVTNASINTWTAYGVGGLTPGTNFLNGPLQIAAQRNTGNNPRAISISVAPGPALVPHHWNRNTRGWAGPATEVIFYADFSDGVVNTTTIAREAPAQQFTLGPQSAPNDIAMSPCWVPGPGIPARMEVAITQGGTGGADGKIAYYLAGPGCVTGQATQVRPDSIVGDLGGFAAPAGVSDTFAVSSRAFFAVAESGSDSVAMVGFALGTNSPEIVIRHSVGVGDNPTMVTNRPAWTNPCIAVAGTNGCFRGTAPTCWYNGTEQDLLIFDLRDGTFATVNDLYVCARGSGWISIIDEGTGVQVQQPVLVPGIRYVASTVRQ